MALKVPEEAEDPEMWFFSFADMMSLLMGYFVLLYSMSNPDESKFNAMAKAISESFGIPAAEIVNTEGQSGPSEQSRQLRAFQMLIAILNLGEENKAVQKVEQLYAAKVAKKTSQTDIGSRELTDIKAELVKQDITAPGLIFELVIPTESLFEAYSTTVKPEAMNPLRRIGEVILKSVIKVEVEITAHSDSRPPARSSGFRDSWDLTAQQAISIARAFTNQGIPSNILSVKGVGNAQPILPEFDRNGRPIKENMDKNQRVQIVVRRTEL